jgi:hypothetical protein
MIQKRLPGFNLCESLKLDKLDLEQWRSVTRQVTDILSSIHEITSVSPGIVIPGPIMQLTAFSARTPVDRLPSSSPPDSSLSVAQTTYQFVISQCERWVAANKTKFEIILPHWHRLKKLAKHLHSRGFLPDPDKFYFHHLDLYARNLLYETVSDSEVKISTSASFLNSWRTAPCSGFGALQNLRHRRGMRLRYSTHQHPLKTYRMG